MSDRLKDFILKRERAVLKEIGFELTPDNADSKHPCSHYKCYEYNLFESMKAVHKSEYGEGSGGELNPIIGDKYKPAKMASIRSSSAMTFNILGNNFIVLNENNGIGHLGGKYSISYEKKLETITSRGRKIYANLDAFLVSDSGDELIFCEMKMMEWFDKNKSHLSSAYLKEGNYPYKELYPKFKSIIENIEAGFIKGFYEHYDVWQMFKHTLAIHNYLMSISERCNIKKVTLLNVVFEPDESIVSQDFKVEYSEQIASEHKGFESFCEILSNAGLIGGDNIFNIKYLSAKDFISEFAICEDRKVYLNRYTFEEI